MDLKKQFETDRALEEEGVWYDVGDGGRVKVARANNRRFRDRFRALARGKERQIQQNILPEDVAEELLCKAMAHGLLLDWSGIEDNGAAVAYSEQAATEMLKRYPDFRRLIDALADNMEAYRAAREEDAEKNSAPSSAGTST